jgi:hypothetical protein
MNKKTPNHTVCVDIDFDAAGHVTKHIAAQAAADPVLHYLVNKMLRGQDLSPEERSYYEQTAPEYVRSESDAG